MGEYKKLEITWNNELGGTVTYMVGINNVIRIWNDGYPTGAGEEPAGAVEQIKVAYEGGEITVFNQAYLPAFTVYQKEKQAA